MSSEKMCWARRQFPARLASLLLLLVVLGLNLLLWQVDNFHQFFEGFIQRATTLWKFVISFVEVDDVCEYLGAAGL